MLEDALASLKTDPNFWVAFNQSVWLAHEDVRSPCFGIYHWLLDLHIFYVDEYGPTTAIVTGGDPEDSDWFYTSDPELLTRFIKVLHSCRDRMQHLLLENENGA